MSALVGCADACELQSLATVTAWRRVERRIWWSSFLVYLALALTWSVAMPLGSGPDEPSQVFRAAAVVRGQLTGISPEDAGLPAGSPPYVVGARVPAGLAGLGALEECFRGPSAVSGSPRSGLPFERQPSDCPSLQRQDGRALVITNQYRHQPTYYLAVGWVTWFAPDATGVRVMRALTALFCAAFVASAIASSLRLPRPRLVAMAIFVALTPTTVYLSGHVNPGAVEVAAALSLWTSGLALVRGEPEPDRRLVQRTGLALVALLLTRGFGPLFAVVAVFALWLIGRRRPLRLRALRARADVRAWLAAGAVALLAATAWLLYIMVTFRLPTQAGTGLGSAIGHSQWFLREMVGVFGARQSAVPLPGVYVWSSAFLLLLAMGSVGADRFDAAVAGAVAVVAWVFSITADGLALPPTGYFWQARYVLPLLAGGVVLATGSALGDRRGVRSARWEGAGLLVILGLLGVVHVSGFAAAVRQVAARAGGRGTFDAELGLRDALLDPNWSPPGLPPWGYLLVHAALVAVLGCVAWCAAGQARSVDHAGSTPRTSVS